MQGGCLGGGGGGGGAGLVWVRGLFLSGRTLPGLVRVLVGHACGTCELCVCLANVWPLYLLMLALLMCLPALFHHSPHRHHVQPRPRCSGGPAEWQPGRVPRLHC